MGGNSNSTGGGSNAAAAKAQYQLPDGQVVNISNERHRASEVLFQPSLIGSEERDRLLYEVRQRAPERTRIRISAPPERRDSAWVGGSILASLATFKNMWVGRNEYEEYGSSILHRGSL
ncbi:actin family protein [Skeletonema marinoi]|uniref:Actin family protein n=1 Tax=Skeletonema marinoi TaxID=267567 RepID=A0AAD8YA28_9STRA|nr:actin family protein [Skeletonema marinoi]